MSPHSPEVPPPLAGRRAVFVSWVKHHGRSEDLAAALGAECRFVAVGTLRNRRTTPFRYLWQAAATLGLLVRRRPRVLVVMAPPAPLVLMGLVWRALTGCRLVVDCHSGAVLGTPPSARLARRADLVLVTLPELTSGFPRVVAVHSPPVDLPAAPRHDELVFPASWFPDEPIEELLAAASELPDLRFALTGRAPAGLNPPSNVRLTGFLSREEFMSLLAGAPVVLALTTREDTMQQAAYEALAAARPVVASDTAALRGFLGEAARYAPPTAEGLAAAITSAMNDLDQLSAAAGRVRQEQHVAFDEALVRIAEALSGPRA